MRVWVRTVGQTHHMLLAKCRLEASDTREVAAEIFGSGGVQKDPLHVVEQRFHIVKLKYSVAKGKQKCPYGRTVVLCQAAENGDVAVALKGKDEHATQWCSWAWQSGGRYLVDFEG